MWAPDSYRPACKHAPSTFDQGIVRLFNRILTSPEDNVTQQDWWVQHTPLVRIDHPWCLAGKQCSRLDYPAYVRCSSEPGANREATPHKEGDWPICRRLLQPLTEGRRRPLAYSFGIAGDFRFDDQLAQLGFEVHSFDPTTRFRRQHEAHNVSDVHFHFGGLQAEASCQQGRARSGGSYGRLDGALLTLGQMRRRLGHAPSERQLDILKIDCEGCEWGAFYQMATQDEEALSQVRFLLLELHVSTRLKLATTQDIRMFEEFFRFVFIRHGFKIAYLRGNPGGWRDRPVTQAMRRMGATAGQCCYELMLVKQSETARTPVLHGGLEGAATPMAANCSLDIEVRSWTGLIVNMSSDTFALGNDAVQLTEALIDAYLEPLACAVSFKQADSKRGRSIAGRTDEVNGFSSVLPSLSSGRIVVRSNGIHDTARKLRSTRLVAYGGRYHLVKPMLSVTLAVMDTVLYEKLLRLHLWPHLQDYVKYRGPLLDDTLVIYLRSDDAQNRLGSWFPEWKRHRQAPGCSFTERCVAHSGLRKLLVVTRLADGPLQHPELPRLRANHGRNLRIQAGSLAQDFATLVNARHLCMDFSTFGFVAALLNPQLRSLYMQRIFRKHDTDAQDDLGWTVPATLDRAVYIISPSLTTSHCPEPVKKPLSKRMHLSIKELAANATCYSVQKVGRLKCNHRKG